MANAPRITLEQWRALQAVVEAGGYAQAAERLHKSQSTLTYAVQQIQKLLGVQVFEIKGRKAVLTRPGQVLYRRAKTLLEEAALLERGAAEMTKEWQPEIRLAVEVIFPTWLLLESLEAFARERPETRIELYETGLTGTQELLTEGRVDLAIGSIEGTGISGMTLMPVRFIAVAAPSHPLHQLGRTLTERDLKRHRRIFLRDTGTQRKAEVSGVELRWTVSNKATQIRAVTMGLAFAWLPEETILAELRAGQLKALPLEGGSHRIAQLYTSFADPEFPGHDVRDPQGARDDGVPEGEGATREEEGEAGRLPYFVVVVVVLRSVAEPAGVSTVVLVLVVVVVSAGFCGSIVTLVEDDAGGGAVTTVVAGGGGGSFTTVVDVRSHAASEASSNPATAGMSNFMGDPSGCGCTLARTVREPAKSLR